MAHKIKTPSEKVATQYVQASIEETMKDTESFAHTQGEGTVANPRRPSEETARLGRELYERNIRRQVEADNHGEIVAIDVDSGSWVVADSEIAALDRLREMHPCAINVLCERVGYRALRSFGAGSLRRPG